MKTKILIVDDNNIFRRGLKLLLENNRDFEVVGEVLNAEELLELLEKINPDIIVIDMTLSSKLVLSIIKSLSVKYPGIPLLLITVSTIDFNLLQCVINGVKGIIWRESTPGELLKAIQTVAAGNSYFPAPESFNETNGFEEIAEGNRDYNHLSHRETEVLKCIAQGKSYKKIAEELFISPRTVESHKNKILLKLNLKTTADLMQYALKKRLIELH
jgi:DNA-binding NarL/FixJ family response regulator